MTQPIPIFYTISNDFAPYAAVAIQSLRDHISPEQHYQVIIVHQGLTPVTRQNLQSLASDNLELTFYEINDEALNAIQNRKENYLRADFFTPSIFYRLFLADLFPQYDKAIYVDSDTVWNGDPADMFAIELGNNLIGAAPDHSVEHVGPMQLYIKEAVGVPAKQYLNSGVLLMNFSQLRKDQFTRHFLNLLQRYHVDCIAPDQDYLNVMCNGRITYLDEKWNAMPKDEEFADERVKDPKLIHYNLFFKPWHFDHVMYDEYFWQAAKKTPYAQQLKDVRTDYTIAQQQLDRQKLMSMLNHADELPDNPVTFKKLQEQGKQVRLSWLSANIAIRSLKTSPTMRKKDFLTKRSKSMTHRPHLKKAWRSSISFGKIKITGAQDSTI